MSTRRDFLATVAALLAAGAVPTRAAMETALDERSHEEVPDEFVVGDWRMRWCGWREPANQVIMFGVWVALPNREYAMNTTGMSDREIYDAERYWVSCTLGSTRLSRAFDIFDTTYSREHGHAIYQWSTELEKLTAKREALKRLIVSVKTGHPFGRVYGEWKP